MSTLIEIKPGDQMTKVALIQISGNADRSAGLKTQHEWVKRSADEGGKILCFPELMNVA